MIKISIFPTFFKPHHTYDAASPTAVCLYSNETSLPSLDYISPQEVERHAVEKHPSVFIHSFSLFSYTHSTYFLGRPCKTTTTTSEWKCLNGHTSGWMPQHNPTTPFPLNRTLQNILISNYNCYFKIFCTFL